MRVVLFCCLCLSLLLPTAGAPVQATAEDFDQSHGLFTEILKAHVAHGLVDYAALKADPAALDRYLAELSRVSEGQMASWDRAEQLAFLLNLYNASTLRLILDHYPVESIKDIGSLFDGPWDQPVVGLYGRRISLNELEHGILRKIYHEPRIHMALVCAAKGCPPLRSEAYTGRRLWEQLDDQTRQLLADPRKFRIDRERAIVYFSPIFKWYGDDFLTGSTMSAGLSGPERTRRAIAGFCLPYLAPADRSYLESQTYSVRFLDYDWSLNRQADPPQDAGRAGHKED
jgi:hypothetical protein